jgi:hypothetical protein
VVAGGGDAVIASEFQDADTKVAQGGHDLGAVAGADLAVVLAVADIADVL